MAKQIRQGRITIEIEDHMEPPPEAGKKTPEQLNKLTKARSGVGLALDSVAKAVEDATTEFELPKGITVERLREAALRAEDADRVLASIDVLREVFRQANLIWDAEAAALLGLVNDQLKAQGKHDKTIRLAFAPVTEYFSNKKPAQKKIGGQV